MDETPKEKKKPKVVIFGKDVTDKEERDKDDEYYKGRYFHHHFHAHHRHGSSIWGFLLIFVGVLLFLNVLNLVPWTIWNGVAHFWPFILILIGIDILLGRSWLSHLVSSLLTFALFATVLGVILLKVSPHTLSGLPPNVLAFLSTISNYLQIK